MPRRVVSVSARLESRPSSLIADLKADSIDFLLVCGGALSDSSTTGAVAGLIESNGLADAIVFVERQSRLPWKRLQGLLPPFIYLMAATPDDDLGVALNVKSLQKRSDLIAKSESVGELVVQLAEDGKVAFIGTDQLTSCKIAVPQLTAQPPQAKDLWLRREIPRINVPCRNSSSTNLTALKAGLFLLHDFFDESHSCSQSIEGLGTHHNGDYWHAILHRREPDYGNSKYWFRHVGRHPVFSEMADVIEREIAIESSASAGLLGKWKPRLISAGSWDPYAFVDLCAAADDTLELRPLCERIQHAEMLLLLEVTYRDLAGL